MRGMDSAKKSIVQAIEQIKVNMGKVWESNGKQIIRETSSLGKIPEGVFDPAVIRRVQIINPLRVIPIMPLQEVRK